MESSVPVALGCDKPRGHSQPRGTPAALPGAARGLWVQQQLQHPLPTPAAPVLPAGTTTQGQGDIGEQAGTGGYPHSLNQGEVKMG